MLCCVALLACVRTTFASPGVIAGSLGRDMVATSEVSGFCKGVLDDALCILLVSLFLAIIGIVTHLVLLPFYPLNLS